MSKLIRRIIKESINEFDWVDLDVSNLSGDNLYLLIKNLFNSQDLPFNISRYKNGDIEIWSKLTPLYNNTQIYFLFENDKFNAQTIRSLISRYIKITKDNKNRHFGKVKPYKLKLYYKLVELLEPIIGTISL
jgi:hypothetical protein